MCWPKKTFPKRPFPKILPSLNSSEKEATYCLRFKIFGLLGWLSGASNLFFGETNLMKEGSSFSFFGEVKLKFPEMLKLLT